MKIKNIFTVSCVASLIFLVECTIGERGGGGSDPGAKDPPPIYGQDGGISFKERIGKDRPTAYGISEKPTAQDASKKEIYISTAKANINTYVDVLANENVATLYDSVFAEIPSQITASGIARNDYLNIPTKDTTDTTNVLATTTLTFSGATGVHGIGYPFYIKGFSIDNPSVTAELNRGTVLVYHELNKGVIFLVDTGTYKVYIDSAAAKIKDAFIQAVITFIRPLEYGFNNNGANLNLDNANEVSRTIFAIHTDIRQTDINWLYNYVVVILKNASGSNNVYWFKDPMNHSLVLDYIFIPASSVGGASISTSDKAKKIGRLAAHGIGRVEGLSPDNQSKENLMNPDGSGIKLNVEQWAKLREKT